MAGIHKRYTVINTREGGITFSVYDLEERKTVAGPFFELGNAIRAASELEAEHILDEIGADAPQEA